MKKILAALLSASMMLSLASCGSKVETPETDGVKVGFIFLHDENSTYDKNFMDAATVATENLGLDVKGAVDSLILPVLPETGDMSMIEVYLLLLLISGSGLFVLLKKETADEK